MVKVSSKAPFPAGKKGGKMKIHTQSFLVADTQQNFHLLFMLFNVTL